jgi:hypothetical protein
MVAVRKNLDLVWVWFYKDVAPMARYEQQTMKRVIPYPFFSFTSRMLDVVAAMGFGHLSRIVSRYL